LGPCAFARGRRGPGGGDSAQSRTTIVCDRKRAVAVRSLSSATVALLARQDKEVNSLLPRARSIIVAGHPLGDSAHRPVHARTCAGPPGSVRAGRDRRRRAPPRECCASPLSRRTADLPAQPCCAHATVGPRGACHRRPCSAEGASGHTYPYAPNARRVSSMPSQSSQWPDATFSMQTCTFALHNHAAEGSQWRLRASC
jgi:hypothetical protein